MMRVAVLTLTRDRLEYTKHCFRTLRENAGCEYDHFVLDQGSTDGTAEWLCEDGSLDITAYDGNLGICRGLNVLLREACEPSDYDVIVRFDNDCEVLQPNTLAVVSELAAAHEAILAPRVLGLRNPPPCVGVVHFGMFRVELTNILGGIFMAIPASLFSEHAFMYDERNQPWAGDEQIVPWWRSQGGVCGYVDAFSVNHYETTNGQHARFPEYFARAAAEGKPA